MRLASTLFGLVVALALGACAHPAPRDGAKVERPKLTTDDYRRYSRGYATAFDFQNLSDWDAPDPNHVVVWVSSFEAYLLTLFGACFNLEHVQTILVAADHGIVSPGGAAIVAANERCPIQTVERLDARAMKADGIR